MKKLERYLGAQVYASSKPEGVVLEVVSAYRHSLKIVLDETVLGALMDFVRDAKGDDKAEAAPLA